MPRTSAGILPYRFREGTLEVLLVHPGGPFWMKKDLGAWQIAKGEYSEGEQAFDAAVREFEEETGHKPVGTFLALTTVKQPGGKVVSAWAVDDPWDLAGFTSNTFELEWPKGSGRITVYPEVDKVEWFDVPTALQKVLASQSPFIEELCRKLEVVRAT